MFFSVIVPVYNTEKYLERCIDSIISQSFKSLEIILVDDGSTDRSGIICDNYKKRDERIRVIHKENGGLSEARNVGIKASQGEYIAFIDSDDWINTDSFSNFHDYITKTITEKVDIYIGVLLNEDKTLYSKKSHAEKGKIYNGERFFVDFNESIINCSVASIYRRLFLAENGLIFPVGRLHEDFFFTPKAIISAEKIVYTGVEYYYRFVREGSITQANDKRENLIDVLWIARKLYVYSENLDNMAVRCYLQRNVVSSYLSKFYDADIYQYKESDNSKYIDKQLVYRCSHTTKEYLKCILYCISPHLYVLINKYIKRMSHK